MKKKIHMSFHANFCLVMIGSLLAATAQAELRSARVCASDAYNKMLVPVELRSEGLCYSGFECTVGMRGDWLDFTNQVLVSHVGRPTGGRPAEASGTIIRTGTNQFSVNCLDPPNKDREGYVLVGLVNLSGQGRLRITANRPGPLGVGVHSDSFEVEVRDGSRYVRPYGLPYRAATGESKVIELVGVGLADVRLKPRPLVQASSNTGSATTTAPRASSLASGMRAPVTAQQLSTLQNVAGQRPLAAAQGGSTQAKVVVSSPVTAPVPDVTILGKTQNMLRLQVNFKERGIYSLGDYLEFAAGDPPINTDMGWPTVDVAF